MNYNTLLIIRVKNQKTGYIPISLICRKHFEYLIYYYTIITSKFQVWCLNLKHVDKCFAYLYNYKKDVKNDSILPFSIILTYYIIMFLTHLNLCTLFSSFGTSEFRRITYDELYCVNNVKFVYVNTYL